MYTVYLQEWKSSLLEKSIDVVMIINGSISHLSHVNRKDPCSIKKWLWMWKIFAIFIIIAYVMSLANDSTFFVLPIPLK